MKKVKNIIIIFILIIPIFLKLLCFNNSIINYYIIFESIICGGAFINKMFKVDYCQSIPIYFFCLFAYLFIFGILNLLIIGIYSFVIISLTLGICIIFSKIIKKEKISFNNPGLIIFSLLYIILGFSTKNMMFGIWDEYSYWSLASKNMFFNNSFYVTKGSVMTIAYPPFPTLLQYFFCKFIGIYSQGIELFSYQLIGFSLLLPILKKLELNKFKKYIILFLIFNVFLFIPSIFIESYFYYTIYADSLLGMLFGYILFEYYTSEKFNSSLVFTLFLGLFCLSLIKATGIIFSVISIIIIMLNEFFKNNETCFFKKNIKKFLILISSFSGLIIWKFYVKIQSPIFNEGYITKSYLHSIKDLFENLAVTIFGGDYKGNISFQSFFNDFFDKSYYISKPIALSCSAIISIFVVIFLYVGKKIITNDEDKKRFNVFSALVFFGSCIYILLLQVAMFLQFSNSEANSHASMQRYAGSLFIGLLILICGITIHYFNKKEKGISFYIVLCAIMLLFTPIVPIANDILVSGTYTSLNNKQFDRVYDFADHIKSLVNQEDRIFTIHQTSNNNPELLQFRYRMFPYEITMFDRFDLNSDELFLKFSDAKKWKEFLNNGYDYVVILDSDEYFENNFSEVFESDVTSWSLYKIIKNNNDIILQKESQFY